MRSIRQCDILIGYRGGDWYPFANSRKGTYAISNHVILVSYGSNLLGAQLACDLAKLTWRMEEESEQTDLQLVDAMGAFIKQKIGQRRRYSALETVANTFSGFVVAFLVNLFLFKAVGIKTTAGPIFWVTFILTGVSIIRGYLWRRFFNWLYMKGFK